MRLRGPDLRLRAPDLRLSVPRLRPRAHHAPFRVKVSVRVIKREDMRLPLGCQLFEQKNGCIHLHCPSIIIFIIIHSYCFLLFGWLFGVLWRQSRVGP